MENLPSLAALHLSAKIGTEITGSAMWKLVAILGIEAGAVCTLANIGTEVD